MVTPHWGILDFTPGAAVRHYVMLSGALVALFLVVFMIVESTGLPLLTDPSAQLAGAAPWAAGAIGVGLLVADVLIPVPSSVVMLMHGVIFGAVWGAVLSLVGSVGAAAVGFAIGRRGGPLLARLVPASERERADSLLSRWGFLAIVITRPIPIFAETVAILAGASRRVSWARALTAALIGSIPAAVLYAVAGALAATFVNLALVFGCVLIIAAAVWLVDRLVARRMARQGAPAGSHP